MTRLSVIIPAYNEADLIAETVIKTCEYLSEFHTDSEVIVVDDGSSDTTFTIVEEIASTILFPLKVINNGRNRGKGFSIRNGIRHAGGEYILFFDADLPYDLISIQEMISGFQAGYDVIVGSRTQSRSVIGADVPPIRKLASKVFRTIVHWMIDLDVEDTQCGFKGFTSRAANEIFSRVTIEGFGFDIEALALAQKMGFRILSIPVTMLKTRHASRIKLARDALRMLADIVSISWNYRVGKYQPARGRGKP